jgi:uncharacterized protein (DUF885 family)
MLHTAKKKMSVFLGGCACAALSACGPPVNEDGIARTTVREINRIFDDTARAELALSPEAATRLGLEENVLRLPFDDILDDRSQARFERTRLLRIELLNRLTSTPPIPGDSQLARHLTVARMQYDALTQLEAYGFGRYTPSLARPYAVDHLSGAWVDVPDLLIARQPLQSHSDAADFLNRLAALPGAISDEKRRLVSDARSGIVPPRIALETLETRLREIASQPVMTHPLIQSFGNVVGGLPPLEGRSANDYRHAATRLMLNEVLPAYVEFADAVADLQLEAGSAPGLSHLPDGEAYYLDLLSFYARPGADPDFLYEEGLQAINDVRSELDAQFSALGLPDGTLEERLDLLNAMPGQTQDLNPETRPALLKRLGNLVERARGRLPDLIAGAPDTSLIVTRMPVYEEQVFSGATYVPASANGSRPALFQINLGEGEAWPDFALPTLVYHEGVPGHHVESMVTSGQARTPLLRQMIWNTAFGEGWATYAEDLADSGTLYANDHLGRIGYLQSILFRAARLVVDTGIHAKGWTYEQAVAFLVKTTGLPRAAMEKEVQRYIVWPGQAVSYFVGRRQILDIRTRAEAVLGDRFDGAEFNAIILEGGPRPLSLVEEDVEAWYERRLSR